MITARVSHLSEFARWKYDEDLDVGWMINRITSNEETEQMRKGTAFHKFLELANEGKYDKANLDGYTFAFAGDFEVYLPVVREWRKDKDYGGITVTGKLDCIEGRTIYDSKTTERFDAEKYLDSWQWRFYLDIFDADQFTWLVWEMNELEEPQSYGVHHLHRLTQYRYPSMHEDCRQLAQEYREFAEKYLNEYEVKL
ncbi:MAG: hypothetical protein KGL39_19360 [Patescibacteria group bacterium]|nr:hypothetical protein [Patescibacteria group bacterium]